MINTLKINKMKNLNYKTMRKIAFALLMLLTLSLNAQDNNVIKFMGIPVDGPKSEIIDKLMEKGFVPEQVEIDLEKAENDVLRAGGELNEGRIRERDGSYFMKGSFDGKRCTLVIMSYKSNVYKIIVAFEDSYKNKIQAFTSFNYYAELLNNKYYNEHNFYRPLDFSDELKLDADLMNAFFVEQNEGIGMITLHITYPTSNLEYHIILEYVNSNNMPNGEDL